MKNLVKNRIKYFNRYFPKLENQDKQLLGRVNSLREKGYLVLDQYITGDDLEALQILYKNKLEIELKFEMPCLSQSSIDEIKHKELIDNYFCYKPSDLVDHNLTFDRSNFSNYEDCLDKFKPSTLKTYLTDIQEFYKVWLDEDLLRIIETYMGVRPHLVEAYLRRNFPAKYKVMNHFWHRDTNHPDFLLKVFIFLSDCDISNGPHEYISQSLQDDRLRGKRYFSETEVDSVYPIDSPQRIKSVVKAGTVVIEDTRGLHRATIPKEGYRDLGFAVFLPLSVFSRTLIPLYKIDQKIYHNLSKIQKSYIPNQNISKSIF
ncbi:MAG: phytanoyl-CoA dioxygenase [Leptospira sp.]|nr:phytanoyl-CoA dioxygenase [Leptospira sp.]